MKAIDNMQSSIKSLDVDPNEQSICFANTDNSMKVVCMQTNDGTVTSANVHSNSLGNDQAKLSILGDNSGYFISSKKYGTSRPYLCKYLFSATNSQCQQITNFYSYSVSQELMLNNNQVFIAGLDLSSPWHLHFLKITAGNTAVDWAKKMTCDGTYCDVSSSECLLDISIFHI